MIEEHLAGGGDPNGVQIEILLHLVIAHNERITKLRRQLPPDAFEATVRDATAKKY
jgi:hypothetical protein